MIHYERRYLLFLDILGFRDYVSRSMEDAELLSSLVDAVKKPEEIDPNKIVVVDIGDISTANVRLTNFSDSIIVTAESTYLGLLYLLFYVNKVYFRLRKHNLFFRGGLVLGEVIHDESMILGPALIEAYDLERVTATYPRVLLSDRILESVSGESKFRLDFLSRFLRTDDIDNRIFCHVLFAFGGTEITREYAEYLFEGVNERVRETLLLNDPEKINRIVKKYFWFSRYLEKTIGKPNLALLKIVGGQSPVNTQV